ncbi:hypothetical protein G4V62_04570 [Bacillaceae bacterium SIJ1]|uniref:VrrA/YqfQ family protein n=1 Tax=Litoribacterium kuwaitense TaxID=1398745 RepID=UPI0013EADABB|nr:VrrA/YqfQ family protein [Litoribacterium kuwaitense]NGP44260.1 hypothetical protein [Litoribacterium kuwaitense]
MFPGPPQPPSFRPPPSFPMHGGMRMGPGINPGSMMPPAMRGMPMPPATPPTAGGGGLLKGLVQNIGSGGIDGMIGNVQNMLKLAESAAPILQQVQQYGPMLKNLPQMFKMLQSFNEINAEDSADDTENNETSIDDDVKESASDITSTPDESIPTELTGSEESIDKVIDLTERPSTPKLYI